MSLHHVTGTAKYDFKVVLHSSSTWCLWHFCCFLCFKVAHLETRFPRLTVVLPLTNWLQLSVDLLPLRPHTLLTWETQTLSDFILISHALCNCKSGKCFVSFLRCASLEFSKVTHFINSKCVNQVSIMGNFRWIEASKSFQKILLWWKISGKCQSSNKPRRNE